MRGLACTKKCHFGATSVEGRPPRTYASAASFVCTRGSGGSFLVGFFFSFTPFVVTPAWRGARIWCPGKNPDLGGKLWFLHSDGEVVEASEVDCTCGSVMDESEIARELIFWHRERHLV